MGKELEYRVTAVSKIGGDLPSDTEMVVFVRKLKTSYRLSISRADDP